MLFGLRRKLKGFTLVELIITVAVMGILLTIVALKYVDVTQGSREAVFEANNKTLISAAELYSYKYNAKPPSYNDVLPFLNGDITNSPPGAVYSVSNGVVTSEYDLHRDADKRILVWLE